MSALKILAIDTSGKVASVAISDGSVLLAEKSVYTRLTHSQIILPIVKELMSDCELDFSDLDAVACAKGPGSYTGLRIGIAAVKGICMGAPNLKCAGISTLEALAYSCAAHRGRIVSVMAARKGIVYSGAFESDGKRIAQAEPDRVCDINELLPLVKGDTLLVGDCCEEIKEACFSHEENVRCAPFASRLQKASSLCMALEENPEYLIDSFDLSAAYLQETKAEKDKAHRE